MAVRFEEMESGENSKSTVIEQPGAFEETEALPEGPVLSCRGRTTIAPPTRLADGGCLTVGRFIGENNFTALTGRRALGLSAPAGVPICEGEAALTVVDIAGHL